MSTELGVDAGRCSPRRRLKLEGAGVDAVAVSIHSLTRTRLEALLALLAAHALRRKLLARKRPAVPGV